MSYASTLPSLLDSSSAQSDGGSDESPSAAVDRWSLALESEDDAIGRPIRSWRLGRLPPASSSRSPFPLSAKERALLSQGGFSLEPWQGDDPAAATRERERRLLREAWDIEQVAALPEVGEGAVDALLQERVLFAVVRDGLPVFPKFQFTHFGLLPGAAQVWPNVRRGLALVAVARWFTEPSAHLVVMCERLAPRDWLLEGGDPEAAAFLARSL